MKLPQIEINGVTYTMKKPKARNWAAMVKFEQDRKKILTIDYVDKICEFIATLFEGLTADDLLDNLMLEEVQKIYKECHICYWDLLSGKFEELEKNSETVQATV